MDTEGKTNLGISEEELGEIRELFPELSSNDLARFVVALDTSIDQILDHYFGVDIEKSKLYPVT